MPSLDEMLEAVQESLRKTGHPTDSAVVLAARKELKRLALPPMEDGLCHFEVATILSHRTKQGMVEMVLNREKTQMDIAKAKEIQGMLSMAIEAAISDTLIYQFLTQKVGLSEEKAGMALADFRELRQGSKESVYPS